MLCAVLCAMNTSELRRTTKYYGIDSNHQSIPRIVAKSGPLALPDLMSTNYFCVLCVKKLEAVSKIRYMASASQSVRINRDVIKGGLHNKVGLMYFRTKGNGPKEEWMKSVGKFASFLKAIHKTAHGHVPKLKDFAVCTQSNWKSRDKLLHKSH